MSRSICSILAAAVIGAACIALPLGGLRAASPPAPVPSARDKCPVCGMFVAGYPNWVVTVTFTNGSAAYFDGAKDMFTWYLNRSTYAPPLRQTEIAAVTVRDYYSLRQIDGREAYFVSGSDVTGPMGHELIPFRSEKDARGFMADHRGKRIHRFGEITPSVLKALE